MYMYVYVCLTLILLCCMGVVDQSVQKRWSKLVTDNEVNWVSFRAMRVHKAFCYL